MLGVEKPVILLLLSLGLPAVYLILRRDTKFKRLVGVTKLLAISLLVVAAASPYMEVEDNVSKTPQVTILDDKSRSAQLLEKPDLEFEEVEANRKVVASGNSSNLKKGLLRNLEENKAYLLVSDLRSSEELEGVAEKFKEKNSTLNILKTEEKEESSVTIKGPDSTVPGAENSFTVRVYSTGETSKPEVILDGKKVSLTEEGNGKWSFKKKFSTKGDHQIKASIEKDDEWERNNEYFKTVKVREKPDILVLGQKATLGEKLEQFYDVDYKSSVPEDLSDYYTIVAKKDFNEADVADYVVKGNGLIYTGRLQGQKDILPVRSIPAEDESKGAKIMLVIDVSVGSGGCDTCWINPDETADEENVKKSKQIAYSLVEKLGFNNKVGAIAYNDKSYEVSKLRPLSTNRRRLKNRIAQLAPSGPSYHHKGLKGAKEMLEGEGNIIWISDGNIKGANAQAGVPSKTRDVASNLDVQTIAVGVNEDKNEDFLREIAELGNGFYLNSENSGRLQFQFAAGGTEGKSQKLVVIDNSHLITEGLEMDSYVAGFDPAEAKLGADSLVSSTSGKPYLTTWRYGVGRVAAFTGGSTDLYRVLLSDPRIATRSVAWSVGDPQRKQDKWIRIDSAREGEEAEIQASYNIPGLDRQGEDLYTGEINPDKLGFHQFETTIYSYNYNQEIEEIGYKQGIEEVAYSTGGTVYNSDEEEEIRNDISQFNSREVVTKKSLADYFILAALIILLSEIGYRKTRGKK